MKTHDAKRVEIFIEAVVERQLTNALIDAGVTGYTVLPVSGGNGQSGPWSREGQIGRGNGMVAVVCIVRPERVDELLEAVFAVVEKQIGMVSVSDAAVVRLEKF
ncbi:MAG: transcriptional regulator [Rhizobiaceae bacterium]|nr:transcriptional regulator [Rhizobiaceae bacterium]